MRAEIATLNSRATNLTEEDNVADKFLALVATKDGDRQSCFTELTDADLMDGEVTVAVEHSTVKYKDGLAITGKVPIIRKFPVIPGVDLAGGAALGGPSLPSRGSRRAERLRTGRGAPRGLRAARPR